MALNADGDVRQVLSEFRSELSGRHTVRHKPVLVAVIFCLPLVPADAGHQIVGRQAKHGQRADRLHSRIASEQDENLPKNVCHAKKTFASMIEANGIPCRFGIQALRQCEGV
jgi:hypothetical protein